MPKSRMADARKTSFLRRPCGIIRITALWVLCRHRHKTHWTGHKSRLDRFSRFNDRKAYAFEELIAEIGNCMTCARLGLTPDFDQSGAYVQSWLRALKDDKRLIFKAASEAQKAAEWLAKGKPAEKEEGAAA